MFVVRASLLVLLASLVAGCGSETPPQPTGPVEIRIRETQSGASTALKVGHILRIELPAQPLEDCAWEVASVDESVLRVPVEEYVPPDVEGASGTAIWRFEAVAAGSTILRMRYVSFAEEVPARQAAFSLNVLVD